MVKCWNSGFEAVIKSVEAPMIDFYTDCIKILNCVNGDCPNL